jgi:Fe-S cluster biogenesis protein NfuA
MVTVLLDESITPIIVVDGGFVLLVPSSDSVRVDLPEW